VAAASHEAKALSERNEPVLAAGAVALVALALVLELLIRRAERALGQYPLWHDVLTTGKWHQLRRVRRGPPVDVLLAGSSQMLMALDPTTVVAPPLRCYNAAIYRGVPSVMTPWLEEVVLPAARPRWVVWGISVLDLNDNGKFHRGIDERFGSALARRRGARPALKRRFALARHPGLLLNPVRAVRLVVQRDPTADSALLAVLGDMGQGMEYLDYDTYMLSDTKRGFVQEEIVNNFSMGGRQIEALERGVAAARRAGARVVLVEMPATQEFTDMYPRRDADVADARALLQATAERLAVPWLPASELPREWFADCVHLNGRGMRAWSVEVGEALRSKGVR
jgi:hypothetical protein